MPSPRFFKCIHTTQTLPCTLIQLTATTAGGNLQSDPSFVLDAAKLLLQGHSLQFILGSAFLRLSTFCSSSMCFTLAASDPGASQSSRGSLLATMVAQTSDCPDCDGEHNIYKSECFPGAVSLLSSREEDRRN